MQQPPARFRRSIFGYSPKHVRAYVAAQGEQPPAPPGEEELRRDLLGLKGELEAARAELSQQAASVRSAEIATREAQDHTREAEQRVAGLEADLRRAAERFDARGEELRATEEQVRVQTSKLDALRAALTAEIQKVWSAEMHVHEVGTELGAMQETLRLAEEELAGERARADDAEAGARAAMQDAQRRNDPWTAGELTPVFDMAERTVTRIIAEARRRGNEELREVQQRVERLRAETSELEAWRDRVEPFVVPVRRSVEEARVEADRVGGLIRQALEPMTSAVSTLGERLVDLAAAASIGEEVGTPASGLALPEVAGREAELEGTAEAASGGVVDVTEEPADSSTNSSR